MPLLNFQKQFAEKVRTGEKTQTIRATRKRPFVVGDKVYLYTGCRTKNCVKLGKGIVTHALTVYLDTDKVSIGGKLLHENYNHELARKDGFVDWYAMRDWFEKTHGLPFRGQLIVWELK